MNISRIVLLVLIIMTISGCGKFDVINRPAPDIMQAQEVCIIDHPDTREGFKNALQTWFGESNISSKVIPAESSNDACDWTLRYYGRWSWDLAVFLSDAEITAYNKGREAGKVNLRVEQHDAYKFEDGEQRIHKMMDMLSGKADHYVIAKPKKNAFGENALGSTD